MVFFDALPQFLVMALTLTLVLRLFNYRVVPDIPSLISSRAWGGLQTVQEAQKKQPWAPKSYQTVKKTIILRIDDWILGDFDTANPFQVVVYLEMGFKSRVMRGNDLKINS